MSQLALRSLGNSSNMMTQAMERLSTGKRVNSAADDAAGLGIATKLKAQVNSLNAASRNATDALALIGTIDGALEESSEILLRMRELAVQSGSGTASNSDKDYMNLEMSNLVVQVEEMSLNTKFNGRQLLRGEQFSFYTDHDIGGMKITTAEADMAVTSLGVPSTTVSIGGGVPQSNLRNVIQAIDTALESVSTKRAHLGAISNRFDHIVDNLQNVIMNTVQSQSRIVDADFSIETANLTRNTVLQQAATSMLAQANAQKNSVLTLIQQ